jgi:hypothetical protein
METIEDDNRIILIGLTALEERVLQIPNENIYLNILFSFLKYFLKSFHFSCSKSAASLNDGIVLLVT